MILPMMRMGGRTTERGAEMARTASFCFGFSFGSKKERQDVSMRSRYGPELPPFASDSALDLKRRGRMSV